MPGFLLRAKELELSVPQEDFSVCVSKDMPDLPL